MIRTASRETMHGGRTPDISGLLAEALERARVEKDDKGLLY
jgi:hypothetical protein